MISRYHRFQFHVISDQCINLFFDNYVKTLRSLIYYYYYYVTRVSTGPVLITPLPLITPNRCDQERDSHLFIYFNKK